MIEKDRVIRRQVTVDVRDLKGILKRETNKIVSIEEMNATIVRGARGLDINVLLPYLTQKEAIQSAQTNY